MGRAIVMTALGRIAAWLAAGTLALALTAGAPARAQFVDQKTWGGVSGGAANAQTITIPNWTSNLAGVPLRFIPGFTNTASATLNVSGVGAQTIKKVTPTGFANLAGGEMVLNQYAVVVWDGTEFILADNWRSTPLAGGSSNLKVTNGGTPNNQLIVTADQLTLQTVGGVTIRLAPVSCTADITTSGAGGLDTGTVVQNTGYYLWVIYNQATNTTSCVFSLTSVLGSVTFPSGYAYAARVGWDFVENVGTKRLNRILCFGRRCQYVVTASTATPNIPIMASGTSGSPTVPTWSAVSTAAVAPATASRLIVFLFGNGGGNSIAAPNSNYGALASSSNPPPCQDGTSASTGQGILCEFALESSNVSWASSGGGGILGAFGWEDNF